MAAEGRRSSARRPAAAKDGAGGSAGPSTRKRRRQRPSPGAIPPAVLAIDDDEKRDGAAAPIRRTADGKKEVNEEGEKVVVVGEEESTSRPAKEAAATGELPSMDRLREELSCAICLEICFEPSTTSCGHSFCVKCLKHAAAKCRKRCPKCRQLISNSRSRPINTVIWNTIQLLFPSEVEARRTSIESSSSASKGDVKPNGTSATQDSARNRNSNTSRSFVAPGSRISINTSGSFGAQGSNSRTRGSRSSVRISQLVAATRASAGSDQSHDAALAYRLQQEEFMSAFDS